LSAFSAGSGGFSDLETARETLESAGELFYLF
jgi:hypothetical protein